MKGSLVLMACCWACQPGAKEAEASSVPLLLRILDGGPTLEEFHFFLEKGYPELQGQHDPELMSYLFDQFVRDEKIFGYAQALGLRVLDDQVETFINEQMTHMTFNLLEEKEQRLWRREIRRRLTIQKFLQKEIVQNVSIDPEEVEKAYQEQADRFRTPHLFRFRELKFTDQGQAKTFLGELARRKSTFMELAPEFAEHSGYLMATTLALEELPKPFSEALQALQPGQLTKVIALEFGEIATFHVLYLEERIPAREVALEEAYDSLRRDLEQVAAKKLLESRLAELEQRIPCEVYWQKLPFVYVPAHRRSEQTP